MPAVGRLWPSGDDDDDVMDDDDFDVMMTFSRVLPEEEVEAERSARNLSLCTQLEINISNIISSKTCPGPLQVLFHERSHCLADFRILFCGQHLRLTFLPITSRAWHKLCLFPGMRGFSLVFF